MNARSASSVFAGLRLLEPSGPARRWLRLIWECPDYVSGAPVERILPHGQCEVSWELERGHGLQRNGRRERLPSAVFIGPSTQPYWVDTARAMHLFGMVFEPGAAKTLLGCSVSDARAGFIGFEELRIGSRVVSEVAAARSWQARAAAVVSVFAALPPPSVHRATRALLRAWFASRERSVKSIRGELCVSGPTFVKHVREDLGLRPGEVRQLGRFRAVLPRVAAGVPLARAALESGYSDQAHMNRDFRRLAGLSPGRVRPRSSNHPFNVPERAFPFVQDDG